MSNLIPIKLAEQAIASLEADIDRLRSRYAEATQENARLKADVERLRKAGDAMASLIGDDYECDSLVVKEWNAAKEGKQS